MTEVHPETAVQNAFSPYLQPDLSSFRNT